MMFRGQRNVVVIPAQGLDELNDSLSLLLEEYSIDESNPPPGLLPEGRQFRVENKMFYFDIGQNNRVIFLRVSEVALVELDIKKDTSKPLLYLYAICTALLVSVHLLGLMMSTCLLPEMEAITASYSLNQNSMESLHRTFDKHITAAWFFSTGLGLLLFLAEVGLIFWIKFVKPPEASYITAALLIPFFVILVFFTVGLYRKVATDRLTDHKQTITDLERFLNETVTSQMTRNDVTGLMLGGLSDMNRPGPTFVDQQRSTSNYCSVYDETSVRNSNGSFSSQRKSDSSEIIF